MLPPVTLHVTLIVAVSPAGVSATAISCVAPSVVSVMDLGAICKRSVALGSVTATGFSQPRAVRDTTNHASVSLANRLDNVCRNVMTGSPVLGRLMNGYEYHQ